VILQLILNEKQYKNQTNYNRSITNQHHQYQSLNNTITIEEVIEQLINTKSFTTPGPDNIPSTILKLALHTIHIPTYPTFLGQLDPAKILVEKIYLISVLMSVTSKHVLKSTINTLLQQPRHP
jgi:hypothetical protein